MTLNKEQITAEIDGVLGRCGVDPSHPSNESTFDDRGDTWLTENSTACLALLDRLAGSSSSYRKAAQTKLDQQFPLAYNYTLAHLVGVLLAFVRTSKLATHAPSRNLCTPMYSRTSWKWPTNLSPPVTRMPRRVLAGSVLEEHLRKLGEKHGVDTQRPDGSAKKADAINADLGKADAYNKLEQKSVTAWLDLRNKAAHGHYGDYDVAQVEALIRDVRSFMTRNPA